MIRFIRERLGKPLLKKHPFLDIEQKGVGAQTPVQKNWDPIHEYTSDFQYLVKFGPM